MYFFAQVSQTFRFPMIKQQLQQFWYSGLQNGYSYRQLGQASIFAGPNSTHENLKHNTVNNLIKQGWSYVIVVRVALGKILLKRIICAIVLVTTLFCLSLLTWELGIRVS